MVGDHTGMAGVVSPFFFFCFCFFLLFFFFFSLLSSLFFSSFVSSLFFFSSFLLLCFYKHKIKIMVVRWSSCLRCLYFPLRLSVRLSLCLSPFALDVWIFRFFLLFFCSCSSSFLLCVTFLISFLLLSFSLSTSLSLSCYWFIQGTAQYG